MLGISTGMRKKDMIKSPNLFKKFCRKVDGNIAITAALSLPVVLMIGFGAIDYGKMVQSDQELKSAAAAAALAAVNEAQIAFEANENVDLAELMEDTAKKVFNSRTAKMGSLDVGMIEVTPTVTGSKLTVEMVFNATYKTQVLGFAGKKTVNIKNSQRATISSAKYLNIALVFDGSSSMGVGATVFDQQKMQSTTGCTFACHGASYNRAKANGATMRIDVAREAAADSIHVIKENTNVDNQVTVGLYNYGSNVATLLDFNSSRAANLLNVEADIKSKVSLQSRGGTNTEKALREVAAKMPNSGSGRTPDDRVQYIVVLTDGVEDYRHGGAPWSQRNHPTYGGLWAPDDPAGCKAIRDRGIHIFFIQTEYLTPTIGRHQNYYNWIDANLNPILDNRFAACAGSADNVFQTSTPKEIQDAFLDVMGEISTPLRLF